MGTGNSGQQAKLLTRSQLGTDICCLPGDHCYLSGNSFGRWPPLIKLPVSFHRPSLSVGPRALVSDVPDTASCHAASGTGTKMALERAHRHAALRVRRTTFPKSLRGVGRCDWPRSASNRRKEVGSGAAGALLRRPAANGRGEHGVG